MVINQKVGVFICIYPLKGYPIKCGWPSPWHRINFLTLALLHFAKICFARDVRHKMTFSADVKKDFFRKKTVWNTKSSWILASCPWRNFRTFSAPYPQSPYMVQLQKLQILLDNTNSLKLAGFPLKTCILIVWRNLSPDSQWHYVANDGKWVVESLSKNLRFAKRVSRNRGGWKPTGKVKGDSST